MPLDFLAEVAGLIAALDPRNRSPFEQSEDDSDGPSLDEFVRAFGEIDCLETTALLAGIAELAPTSSSEPVRDATRPSEPTGCRTG